MAKRKKQAPPIEHAGNRWSGCLAPDPEALDRFEAELGRRLPERLRELLLACGGGAPETPFFSSMAHETEAHIGYVLPVDPGRSKRTGVLDALGWIRADSARTGSSAADLIPFAVDNGNAHFYCIDGEGRVVYRILHEPAGQERRVVADSLEELLGGLVEPPY